MSADSTLVTEEHFRYIAERTTREDAFLRDLKQAAKAEGIPPIWIAPEQASFMQILLKGAKVREVLEVGTLAGYSAISMARAGCRVKTLEIVPKFADFARRWVAKSDVAGRVEVVLGDAKSILPGLPADSADAAFLDADKAGYPVYLKECLRIVRKGGLILVDNAFAFGELFAEMPQDRETPAVREFNEIMARTKELHSVILPIGDGLWVGVKAS